MSSLSWNATIIDAPESEPFAIVGDLVVAVRTPRSREFVTVEVGRASRRRQTFERAGGVVLSPMPSPVLGDRWQGEVRIGDPVSFDVDGELYRLTLARLAENPAGTPWVACDFVLERT